MHKGSMRNNLDISEGMIKMKKKIFFVMALVFVSILVAVGSYNIYLSHQKQLEKSVARQKEETPKDNKTIEQKDNTDFSVLAGDPDFTNEECIYHLMHYMINTKIESDAIWGTLELTKNRVRILIEAVNTSNWSDKDKLLEILKRWKNDDFSMAVEDHNYIWGKLGGKDGKATAVKK